MNELNGQQKKKLVEALSKAFPSPYLLTKMLEFQLDLKLTTIVPTGSVEQMTFNLIEDWAEPKNKIADLIVAARKENSDHKFLKEVAEELLPVLGIPDVEIETTGEANSSPLMPLMRSDLGSSIESGITSLHVTADLDEEPELPVVDKESVVLQTTPIKESPDVFFEGPTYALVIGISNYKHSPKQQEKPGPNEFAKLKFGAKDATDFADFLTRHGVDRDDIKTLINDNATLTNIKIGLRELKTKCALSGPNSLAIVYFAGHGMADNDNNHYLVPWEGEKAEPGGTCLWNKDFQNYLEEVKTTRLVVFLDACDAGGYSDVDNSRGEEGGVGFDAGRDLAEGVGRCIIASCSAGQISIEGEANGIFTGHLLEVLGGGTDDIKEPEITIDNLYPPLKSKVSASAWKNRQKKQEPTLRNPKKTRIVLAINQRLQDAQKAKRKKFLEVICERIVRPEFICDTKVRITEKLTSYVENGRQFDGYSRFYQLFDDYSDKCNPLDFLQVDECVQLLIDSHTRALDAAPVSTESPLQQAMPVNTFDQTPGTKVPGVDKLQTVSPQSASSDPQEARWKMSEDECKHILKRITVPRYYAQALELRMILAAPVSLTDFMNKTLELGVSAGADNELLEILKEMGLRFEACWKNRTNAPKKLSDFLTNR